MIIKNRNSIDFKMVLWINLMIGIYNLNVFTNTDSIFHLILGSLNIAVWVFYRRDAIPHRKVSINKRNIH